MAQAILPQPASRTPAKRTPPAPRRVFETYQHEYQAHGEWGAYTRTGQRYDRTPEWARKTIAKYRAIQAARERAAAEVDELAYVPPPDAYPEPVPAPVVIPTPTLDTSNSPTSEGGGSTSTANGDAPALQLATEGEFQPLEPEGPDNPPAKNGPSTPGHARPEVNDPDSEMPELPPEAFPNPEPKTPPDDPDARPSGPPHAPWQHSDSDEPRPRKASAPVRLERVVVRVPVEPPARHDLYSRLATLNLDTLAGPQLAIPIDVLLIVLAFGVWG